MTMSATMTERHKKMALWTLVIAQFMIVLDVSIVNISLPSIQRDFRLSISDLQWLVTAYTLAFGGFLLLGGRAADLYGRRRIFLFGVTGFTLASLAIGVIDEAAYMVPLRALQGFSAAFMSPAALSFVLTLFEGQARTRALSIWGAVSAGGATAGLLLGGILTTYLNWRWNFFVNVPVGLFVIYNVLRLLPAHVAEERRKNLDLPGAVLVTGGLMLLVYSLTHAASWGWQSSDTISLLSASIALLILFIWNEKRARHPLMPLSFFRVGNVRGALLTQLPITAGLFSCFFFLSQYVQNILGYTALQSGLSFLPMSLLIGTCAALAPRVIKLVGYKPIMVVAPLLLATGLYILAGLPVDGTYTAILPGILVIALALGFSFISVAVAATSGVPGHESGLASGLLTTSQQIGGSIGLAILSSVAASKTTAQLARGVSQVQALVDGFHAAFYTGMGFAILASISALLLVRSNIRAAEVPVSAH